jgi:hypothetical protein
MEFVVRNLPYCHKCGAELKEDDKFCHVCGTPVSVPSATGYEKSSYPRRPRVYLFIPVIILVAILLTAMIIGVLVFVPMHAVSFNKLEEITSQTGIETLNLNFTADLARVNVTFEHLVDKLVVLNVSATGNAGMFAPSNATDFAFNYTFNGNVLTVTSRVTTSYIWSWSPWLKIACDLHIDQSLKANLNIKTSTGKIDVNTKAGVVLDSLDLETGTGGVEARLVKNTVVNGDILVKTVTGGVQFSWDNVKASSNVSVRTETTTGGISLNVVQNQSIPANVTMNAQATTGGIDLNIGIHDDVAAKIVSTVTTGGIHVDSQTGFNGTKSLLQSSNYPTGSNFNINLKTTTGGINIAAEYTSGTILSA